MPGIGGLVGAFFEAGASLIGGAAKGIGGLLGGGAGGAGGVGGFGAIFGNDVFGLGSQIFGGSGGGFFSSPIAGNILGAVGQELLKPSTDERVAEAMAIEEGRRKARQRTIRENYGLPADATGPYVSPYRPERTAERYGA